jgi:hypothetical protein
MAPSKGWHCQTCGEPVARMDGMTGSQIMAQERTDREEWEPVEAEPSQEEE